MAEQWGETWRKGQGAGVGRGFGSSEQPLLTTINLSPQAYFNILIASVAILLLNVSSAIKYEKGRLNSHTLIASESLGELLVENTDVQFPPQTFPLNDTLWGPGAAHHPYET